MRSGSVSGFRAGPGRLFFTVGLPQSGKSTWCNAWVRDAGKHDRPRVVLAGDDFRHGLHGHEYLVEAEAFVFAAMDLAARALLRRGFDVMMDETATSEGTILRYLRIDIDAVAIFIDVPAEECKARARAAGRDYLLGPIDRMAAQLARLRDSWHETLARLKSYVRTRAGHDVPV